ncbi:MAG: 50S ribosomal protein L11 methyltransferase [Chitinophagales bacterium]
MDWTEIRVTTEQSCVDAIAGLFYVWGAGGVAIEDPTAVRGYIERGEWDAHNYSDDYLVLNQVMVSAFFPLPFELDSNKLKQVNDATGPGCKIKTTIIREEDWADNWKTYYHITRVGSNIVIKPSWREYESKPEDLIIELDPGMAFGTGTHITTRQCLELLEEKMTGGESVLDIGTGSGILAIAAVLLGAKQVAALEIDPVAVGVAGSNFENNQVDQNIVLNTGDFADYQGPDVDVLIANLTGNVIIKLLDRITHQVKPGGLFIGAGINREQWITLKIEMDKKGLQVLKTLEEEEWVGVLARRPSK